MCMYFYIFLFGFFPQRISSKHSNKSIFSQIFELIRLIVCVCVCVCAIRRGRGWGISSGFEIWVQCVLVKRANTEFNNTFQQLLASNRSLYILYVHICMYILFLTLTITICYRNKLLKILGRLFPNLSQYFACYYLVSSLFLSFPLGYVNKLYISLWYNIQYNNLEIYTQLETLSKQ